MYWKQYNENDVPLEEVLAKSKQGCLMVGHLDNTETCYSGFMSLENVTHYILVSDLIKLHNELKP
jgi:hypothetical protein